MTAKKNSFYHIYEKYRYLMFSVAMDVLNDTYFAEDAVQNTFIKIIDIIGQLDDLDSNQTQQLIITITKNTAIDLYRKRNIQWTRETDLEEASKTPNEHLVTDPTNHLLSTIDKLPEKYKEVLLLKYTLEFSNKEIADILEISELNVRKRISRAKKHLEQLIRKED